MFDFIDILFENTHICLKMVKKRYAVFMENLKMNRKRTKNKLLKD